MKKIFVVLCLLPIFAQANFSGSWTGTGQIFRQDKPVSSCPRIGFQFLQGNDFLQTISGLVDCSPLRIQSTPKIVRIVNGRLLFNGIDMGWITNNEIHSEYIDAKTKWHQLYSLHLENPQQLRYLEQVTLENGFLYYRVEALLSLGL